MRVAATITLVATLALAMSFASASAAADRHGDGKAMAAKKKCKKGKKSAAAAKKKCKKRKDGAPAPVPPAPLALTAPEVINQIVTKAHQYCLQYADCIGSGYYYDGDNNFGNPSCDSRMTYVWTCFGWNEDNTDADPQADRECRFREVVQRSGLNLVASYQDTSFDGDGWLCFAI
jgi:hypothetical protein